MRKLLLVGIVFLLLVCIGTASAANLVRNGGFEEPLLGETTGFVECPDTMVPDWVIGGAGIDLIRTARAPSEGKQSIDLSQQGSGSVSQSIPTTAGGSYTLSFDMAGNPACGPAEKLLKVYWGSQTAYGPYSYSTTGYPITGTSGWQRVTLADLPGTAGETQLTFEDVSTPSSACGVALDNIIVTSKEPVPVPEFPTVALPVMTLSGTIGSVFYIRSTREQ